MGDIQFHASVLILGMICLLNGFSVGDAEDVQVRLSRDGAREHGRVEVYHNGEWRNICGNSWDNKDASVICRQLGRSDSGTAFRGNTPKFGRPSDPAWLDEVNCSGSESNIGECGNNGWGFNACVPFKIAAVMCGPEPRAFGGLKRGASDSEGQIVIYAVNSFGTVCDHNWDDNDASVMCRHLGLGKSGTAAPGGTFPADYSYLPILLDNVHCSGSESYIDECPSNVWGDHNCSHSNDAGVRCETGLFDAVVVDQHQLHGEKSTSTVSLYAVTNTPGLSFEWSKKYKSGRPGSFLNELAIDKKVRGFNLTIPVLPQMPNEPVGFYISRLMYEDGRINHIGAPVTLRDCLQLNKKSITVYPKEEGSPLLKEKLHLRVSEECSRDSRIAWRRNGVLLQEGLVKTISTTNEARGVYKVSRTGMERTGWVSLIEIIVSDCPEGYYKDGNGDCSRVCPVCKNNGVCDLSGKCQCPPCFHGPTCESVRPTDSFGVGLPEYHCSDLSDRDTCEGLLFCYGKLYGCSCGCGWHGHNCEQSCSTGKFGADCAQDCHCVDDECNRETGECVNGCMTGWTGFNCQDPM